MNNFDSQRPLVPCPVRYALCLSRVSYGKCIAQFKIDADPAAWLNHGANATTHIFTPVTVSKTIAIVCLQLRRDVNAAQVHGLLVHEAVHIWQEIRDRLGERSPSSEFEAYSIQGIAQELFELLGEMRKEFRWTVQPFKA